LGKFKKRQPKKGRVNGRTERGKRQKDFRDIDEKIHVERERRRGWKNS